MPCQHATACPLARVFAGKPSLRVWSERYCEGRFEACARYARVAHGGEAPAWLLPNGRSLDALPAEPLRRRFA